MPNEAEVFTVSMLAAHVRGLLEKEFASIWVAGEVSNYVRASSGHIYLSLKDASATLKCAFFRGSNLRLKFDPRDGLEVLARGRMSYYPQRGETQFIIEELQPKGLGAADLALRQLKERLLSRGYFDPRRKRPLPNFPRRIALVASATGAAVRDMIELLAQRWPLAEVIVRHARVQGTGSAREIAASVVLLNALHARGALRLDAIVLGRGGGSAEDLAAFDEEAVADAIFHSAVPVVSAVGHEIDVTVADLVADHRAETPSAAVVALTPNRREILAGLHEYRDRYGEAVARRLDTARQRLDQVAARPSFRKPLSGLRDREQKLDELASRFERTARVRLDRAAAGLAAVAARLESLSPLNVLRRGYSLTRRADGPTLIRDAADVSPGTRIVTRVASGEIASVVESTVPANST